MQRGWGLPAVLHHFDGQFYKRYRNILNLCPGKKGWNSCHVACRLVLLEYGGKIGRLAISIPEAPRDPYRVFINFGDGTILYNNVVKYYDQKTLKELSQVEKKEKEVIKHDSSHA